ncbi:YojF family protein [Deinococcus yavapaiensis]|uniref:Uncharacterized protein DUF1806 n=1 Tax=Deinococcus yavapaiensis KR-236 TaxID=694435 RepID=A0A318SCA9_9DEIO|nr:YojF family protein [Deinococcus yavapaiensis]PYE54048.1 uncharacterized protein DUF1806 [Deinococcus yavapaiensis KR-236]
MKPIDREAVQAYLSRHAHQDLYLHLETSTGAYAALTDKNVPTVAAIVRNTALQYERGTLTGTGPYRVGLKLQLGWVYAEGLTDWHVDEEGRLLLAGHDADGALLVALQLGRTPFRSEAHE